MNILIFTLEFPPFAGGAGYYNYNLALGFSEVGHKVTVFTCEYPELDEVRKINQNLRNNNVKVVRNKVSSKPKIWFLQSCFYLYRYLRSNKEKYDIVLVTEYRAQLVYSLISKIIRKKYAITVHGSEVDLHFGNKSFIRFLIKLVVNRFFSNSYRIITGSLFTKKLIYEYNRGWLDRVKVVHYGVNMSEFVGVRHEREEKIRKKLGLSIDDKIIVSVSRIIKEKGHDMLIRSLPIIIKSIPSVKLVIVGDGPYMKNLQNLAERLNISSHIVFTGKLPRKDIPYWLKSSDVFVLLSRDGDRVEGFGLVYLEANACGKAVIAGRTGGVPEAVEDGVSGLLVSPTDVNEISSKIIKLLTDDALRLKLEKQSYNRVCKEFTNTIMAKNTIEALFKNG